jgi:hypothetical protein
MASSAEMAADNLTRSVGQTLPKVSDAFRRMIARKTGSQFMLMSKR